MAEESKLNIFKKPATLLKLIVFIWRFQKKIFLKKSDGFGAFFSTNVLCICHTLDFILVFKKRLFTTCYIHLIEL